MGASTRAGIWQAVDDLLMLTGGEWVIISDY